MNGMNVRVHCLVAGDIASNFRFDVVIVPRVSVEDPSTGSVGSNGSSGVLAGLHCRLTLSDWPNTHSSGSAAHTCLYCLSAERSNFRPPGKRPRSVLGTKLRFNEVALSDLKLSLIIFRYWFRYSRKMGLGREEGWKEWKLFLWSSFQIVSVCWHSLSDRSKTGGWWRGAWEGQ